MHPSCSFFLVCVGNSRPYRLAKFFFYSLELLEMMFVCVPFSDKYHVAVRLTQSGVS